MDFEALTSLFEKEKENPKKKERDLSAEFDVKAEKGVASASNAEKLVWDLDEDAADTNERGGGLVGIENPEQQEKYYQEKIEARPADKKVEFALKMASNKENATVSALGIRYLRGAALTDSPEATIEIRLNAVKAIRTVDGNRHANDVLAEMAKAEYLDWQIRFAAIDALAPFAPGKAKKALEDLMIDKKNVDNKTELAFNAAQSNHPMIRMAGEQYLNAIALADAEEVEEKDRERVVDFYFELGVNHHATNLMARIAQSRRVPTIQRVNFALKLAERDPSRARSILRRMMNSPSFSPAEKLTIDRRMAKSSNEGVHEDGVAYAVLIALSRSPRAKVDHRAEALEILETNADLETFVDTVRKLMVMTSVSIADRIALANESMKRSWGDRVLTELIDLIDSQKISKKDQWAIVSKAIAPHGPQWARNYFQTILNKPHRNSEYKEKLRDRIAAIG